MRSPFTGKEMPLKKEEKILTFRKEDFEIVHHSYYCKDSKEHFTTTKLDEINLVQLYNKYRAKYHLPFVEEIKAIRAKYHLSAVKMSEVLGFGINSYRNYENGEMPSLSNGKLIKLVNDPNKIKDLVLISDGLSETVKAKILNRVEALIEKEKQESFTKEFENYLVNGLAPDEFSGFKKPDLARFAQMILFFAEKLSPWKTQLNKLLFYTDFLMFKQHGIAMSGMRYKAIQMGPVPNNFNSIFDYFMEQESIEVFCKSFDNGGVGEQFLLPKNKKFDASLFNEKEVSILNEVLNKFAEVKTNQIIEISHQEKAWKDNESNRSMISYQLAFYLNE